MHRSPAGGAASPADAVLAKGLIGQLGLRPQALVGGTHIAAALGAFAAHFHRQVAEQVLCRPAPTEEGTDHPDEGIAPFNLVFAIVVVG
ncbi:hypothetical protein D3C84_871320 [compost metagenome]